MLNEQYRHVWSVLLIMIISTAGAVFFFMGLLLTYLEELFSFSCFLFHMVLVEGKL